MLLVIIETPHPICVLSKYLLQEITFIKAIETQLPVPIWPAWGGGIAQSLASLSTKRAIRVCARLDPLVTER